MTHEGNGGDGQPNSAAMEEQATPAGTHYQVTPTAETDLPTPHD